jgi:hypothetical protein
VTCFPLPVFHLLEATPISPEVEVNIKVLHDDPFQIVEQEAYLFVGDQEAEVPIFEIRDMKGCYYTSRERMQRKADR